MHPCATLLSFQLKYCERCGGLWLRPDAAATPYCPVCEHFMAELPLRVRPARKPVQAVSAPPACPGCTA